jgi:Fe-S-cluster containining protein
MKAFECKRCGTCCYGEGGIMVEEKEVRSIASFLGVTPECFVREYCEDRKGKLSIKIRGDGYCIFFDEKRLCAIHGVKPRPCRIWPFYPALLKDKENWEAAKDACPGISRSASFEDFLREAEE